MSDEISDLDEVFGFLAEERRNRRDPEEHPSPETLTAYQAKELSPAEDERIQSHLAACQHCTEMLLELEEFLRPAEVGAVPTADFEAAADWRKLREGLGPGLGGERQTAASRREDRLAKSLRAFQALAAVLGIMAIGLAWHLVRSQGLSSISPPVAQKTLYFAQTRAAGHAEKPVEIGLPLALGFSTAPDYPRYRLELLAQDGHLHYSVQTDLSTGVIPLKKDALSPGIYEVRLWGLKDGRAEPIGEPQRLSIQPRPQSGR